MRQGRTSQEELNIKKKDTFTLDNNNNMYVVKRSGKEEPVHFDKITARITKLAYGLNPDFCDPVSKRRKKKKKQKKKS